MERVISSRGWENLRAVRNGHFFISPGPLDFFAHHGPSFIREVLPWAVNKLESI
jgi:ABC-type Fe3+-hydroxamate transport system substrate-binding protein